MKDAVLPPTELQYNAMSFERCKLLFRSIFEDILFGVTGWKVGNYKHSTKESVNDDRIKDSTKESQHNINILQLHSLRVTRITLRIILESSNIVR